VGAITWNLFHGRDFPPNPELFTWRSRLLRITERDSAHLQVNRELTAEFAAKLASWDWDIALLQECPPRFEQPLATACDAEPHRVLTSRNTFQPLSSWIGRVNPDLTASWEGGSNLTLVRGSRIAERSEVELCRNPERRAMALTRLDSGLCVGNLHASTSDGRPEADVRLAAERAVEFAGDAPLLLGGDFNLRPSLHAKLFAQLDEHFGLRAPAGPDVIDHLLARGLDTLEPPAQLAPGEREVGATGAAIRLADHAPVRAAYEPPD
jgi:endonuclease/exonuclease/phosphatase family metal-dependent hydrolase